MRLNKIKIMIPAALMLLFAVSVTSCMKDLDKGNINPNVEKDPNINALFAKCYACLIMEGIDGAADFTTDDSGKSTFVRNVFNANVLSTDESICWWTDGGLEDYGVNDPKPSSDAIRYLYYRLIINLSFCNHFLELGADPTMMAEVRFIRAYIVYQMMDLFGDPAFIPAISTEIPKQAHKYNPDFVEGQTYTRAELLTMGRKFLFSWIESELKTAEAGMMDPRPKTDTDLEYGRADKAAAWMLLSRLYLNAGTYLNNDGQNNPYWQEALTYAEKVINSGYSLFTADKMSAKAKNNGYEPYDLLFMGDNGSNGSSCEALLPLLQDGRVTKAWGGTRFLIAALWNKDMENVIGLPSGTNDYWSGMRARPQLVEKFTNDPASFVGKTTNDIREMGIDDRALFWGIGNADHERTLSIRPNDANGFFEGLAITKWNNNYSTGETPHNETDVDIDYFLFRVAEAYLNAAEAEMHINGEGTPKSKQYIDALRNRAHAVVKGSYNLQDVLDERARELYYEGMRRPDLIRYNQFGGLQVSYGWELKGGGDSYTGATFDKTRNVYPIPSTEIMANPSLIQIDGYTVE